MNDTGPELGIIGLGYVGLATAVGFAEKGYSVLGTDYDPARIETLKRGEPPFYEPGLGELLGKHVSSGRLRFVDDTASVVREARTLFICVGTPESSDGAPDLSHVEQVVRSIAGHLDGYRLIVEKSTVPVTTADRIRRIIAAHSNGAAEFDVASNPEFLREGSAINDFLNPERVVLGVDSERARKILEELYASFDCPIFVTGLNTVELIKHASNTFLAMRVSFINMVSDMCEATGADVTEVAGGMGLDSRIGRSYLEAGLGYGGYCLPKDLRAFIHIGEQLGVDVSLLTAIEGINNARIDLVVHKITEALWVLSGKKIGILGLSFKPGTDDTRESPSLRVAERLLEAGVSLRLHDPKAMENARDSLREGLQDLEYCQSPYDAADGADALLILTAWPEYAELDLERVHGLMASPVIVDGRNVLDPAATRDLGFDYTSVGRP